MPRVASPAGVLRLLVRGAAVASIGALASCTSAAGSAPATDAGDEDAGAPSFLEGGLIDPLASDASYALRVDTLFHTTCAGVGGESFCHGAGASQLRLVIAFDGGDVVGVRSIERPDLERVAPGDPLASYLYLKVLGDGGIDGGRMPLNSGIYDSRLTTLIYDWIEAGAPPP